MDTVFIPNCLKHLPDMESFRRLEVFANLATQLEHSEDTSLHVVKTLLQYPPKQGLTAMNGVLGFLKDTVLAHQAAKLAGNQQAQSPDTQNITPGKIPKYELFPRAIRSEVSRCIKALTASITEHKTVMKKLRDAQQGYINQNSHLKTLVNKYRVRQSSEGPTPTAEKGHNSQDPAALMKPGADADKSTRKLWDRIIKQGETEQMAFVRVIVLVQREKKMRDFKLKQLEAELRSLIEYRITALLGQGLFHLVQFGQRFGLQEGVAFRIGDDEVKDVVRHIYNEMCGIYTFPKIESYANNDLIPEVRFESPDLAAENKRNICPAAACSASGENMEEEGYLDVRREEIYVRASEDSVQREAAHFLRFHSGQKLKQKLCSSDGTLAFGWRRRLPGGCKTYGFYPTHSVNMVS